MAQAYASPLAFKQALEQRLKSASTSGVDFARRRQLLVFDRFLARIVGVFGDAAVLKGGLALELRLERARTTKDLDICLTDSPATVLARLQEAGRQALGDYMSFEVTRDPDHPTIQNDGMPYEGLRFRAVCRVAGKLQNPMDVPKQHDTNLQKYSEAVFDCVHVSNKTGGRNAEERCYCGIGALHKVHRHRDQHAKAFTDPEKVCG